MAGLFRLFSRFPLAWAHALGAVLGWLVFLVSPVYRRRFLDHAAQAGLAPAQWRSAVAAAGQVLTELPRLWFGAPVPVVWQGEQAIEAALAAGRGVLFLTPHLGCFEVTAQAYALRYGARQPMTVLFRPPRKPGLRQLVQRARARPGLRTAPASLSGVRQLVRALRQGECVGLLPDQVPPQGQGDWQPFFGRPAYTMTLAHRLAQQEGVTVLLAWGERLPGGRGYCIRVQPVPLELAADPAQAGRQINQALETLIRSRPQQYLWGYARYKAPREAV
ncbi:MAG: lysophospholipid acyltransferase family protein [Rhodoferax sp.]|nr:lysophospholipid acyltransferase family protein [Rhodoferax sp.]